MITKRFARIEWTGKRNYLSKKAVGITIRLIHHSIILSYPTPVFNVIEMVLDFLFES